jgi:hypothetical protein
MVIQTWVMSISQTPLKALGTISTRTANSERSTVVINVNSTSVKGFKVHIMLYD